MKYFYEKPEEWSMLNGFTYTCNHPLYDRCTLYFQDGKGIAVIQQRYDYRRKMSWWGPIDPWLIDDISTRPNWKQWFDKYAKPDEDGIYPTFTIRQVMWAMKMKPLKRKVYEDIREINNDYNRET